MKSNALHKVSYQVDIAAEWGLQEPAHYAPPARTQLFDLKEPAEQVLQKLLAFHDEDGWGIDAFILERPKAKEQSWEVHLQAVYKEIRHRVADKIAVKASSALKYEVLREGVRYLVIYLSPQAQFTAQKLHDIQHFNTHQIAQTVLALRIKLLLLEDVAQYSELGAVDYNSDLYFGAAVQPGGPNKKGEFYIDALKYELFYSPDFQDLTFELFLSCFRAKNAGLGLVGDEDRVLIANQTTLQVIKKVDGRRYSKMPYMRFANKDYAGCRNHAENRLQRLISDILTSSKIAFTPRVYQATHCQLQFLSAKEKRLQRPLVLIDNLGECTYAEQRQAFLQQLKTDLAAADIIQPTAIEALSPNCNYLVINAEQKDNGSSITALVVNKEGELEQKQLNTFWQALAWVQGKERSGQAERLQQLDYYSQLKVSRFLAFEQHYSKVLQGLNIDLSKVARFKPEAAPIIAPQSAMLRNELSLKEAVLVDGCIDGFQVPDGQFILVAVRNFKKGKGKASYIAVTHIEFKSGRLSISPAKLYEDEQRLRYEVPGMSTETVDQLRDGSFYLVDVEQQVVINRYSTSRVPHIIGSAERCSLQEAQANAGKIKKTGHPQRTCLPYYLTPKPKGHPTSRYQQLFIQKNGDEALLFCSTSNQISQSPHKAIRVYNLVAKDFSGQPVDALNTAAAQLLLRTYTLDLLRYKEVTQSSLLEKIARMALEN